VPPLPIALFLGILATGVAWLFIALWEAHAEQGDRGMAESGGHPRLLQSDMAHELLRMTRPLAIVLPLVGTALVAFGIIIGSDTCVGGPGLTSCVPPPSVAYVAVLGGASATAAAGIVYLWTRVQAWLTGTPGE
jgi:hypothetical protein